MTTKLKCPFKSNEENKECDRERCQLWHEGGCAFVQIARSLEVLVNHK